MRISFFIINSRKSLLEGFAHEGSRKSVHFVLVKLGSTFPVLLDRGYKRVEKAEEDMKYENFNNLPVVDQVCETLTCVHKTTLLCFAFSRCLS